MLNTESLKKTLLDYYPKSPFLTDAIIEEMARRLNSLQWEARDFEAALGAYRDDPIRADDRVPYHTAPLVHQLLHYSAQDRREYAPPDLPRNRTVEDVKMRNLIGKAELRWRLCLAASPLFGPSANLPQRNTIAQRVWELRQDYIRQFGEPCRTWLTAEFNERLDETLALMAEANKP